VFDPLAHALGVSPRQPPVVQIPALHSWPALQAWPQLPQFVGSFM